MFALSPWVKVAIAVHFSHDLHDDPESLHPVLTYHDDQLIVLIEVDIKREIV
ncbi:hypothetical protein D3C81_1845580 [compost metagenome]